MFYIDGLLFQVDYPWWYRPRHGEDYEESEVLPNVPKVQQIKTGVKEQDLLVESLVLLKERVESGSAIAEFEQLFRHKAGFTNRRKCELEVESSFN